MEFALIVGGIMLALLIVIGSIAEAATEDEAKSVDEVYHVQPGFHTSQFGWESIRICKDCGARGGHWDHMFCVDPCQSCGASHHRAYDSTGKWNKEKRQWLTRKEFWEEGNDEEGRIL